MKTSQQAHNHLNYKIHVSFAFSDGRGSGCSTLPYLRPLQQYDPQGLKMNELQLELAER